MDIFKELERRQSMASRVKLIQWYKSHQGIVTYSQEDRQGPSTYDSASAMFEALIFAGYLPRGKWLGNISVLAKMEGTLMNEISVKEKRRGDIFISRPPSDKHSVHEGHVGVMIDHRRIILCCQEYDGIVIIRQRNWPEEDIHWYRLCYPVSHLQSLKQWLQQCYQQLGKKGRLQALESLPLQPEPTETADTHCR